MHDVFEEQRVETEVPAERLDNLGSVYSSTLVSSRSSTRSAP
jgi:hypothetical protein